MKLVTIMTLCMENFLCIVTLIEGARILAIIPLPSYSHQISFRALWTALSQRGHEVIVLTTDPIGDPSLTNLTEIDFKFSYKILKHLDFVQQKYSSATWLNTLQKYVWDIADKIAVSIYEHPEVSKLYASDSGQKFDVIFAEISFTPGLYALAHRFNAPLIGIMSLGLCAHNYYLLGAPVLTSHPSVWDMENDTGFNLSLWRRLKNFIRLWYHMYCTINQFIPRQQVIAEKYLGKDIPNISDMERNMSIVFCNQQEILSFARPKTPNIISFGNFHILKEPIVLSKELNQFLDNVPNGFIYVSLGTNVAITSFSKHVQNTFLQVFANLPCKVVWKADIPLTDKPDNVYIAKWFPQQSILAHPKIKLFVYQGGAQSTEEAVYYAVPLLGLPILADQDFQINRMISLGVAERLTITDISSEALNASITNILNNKRYKEKMLEVKALSEDLPYNYLENTIWWTEFVIRHKGAPQLHNSIAHDPWYQRYDMDIVAILSVITFIILLCVLIIIYKLLKVMFMYYAKASDAKAKIN